MEKVKALNKLFRREGTFLLADGRPHVVQLLPFGENNFPEAIIFLLFSQSENHGHNDRVDIKRLQFSACNLYVDICIATCKKRMHDFMNERCKCEEE